MTELEKALSGMPYGSRDKEVKKYLERVKDICWECGRLKPGDPKRQKLLNSLFGQSSEYVFIEPGFQCVFGKNIYFKGMAMLNYNCILLDSARIEIGHKTLIGPGCSLICTNHSVDAEERLQGVFRNREIVIGSKVWLGANVTVCPGVTIGDRAVIGAGSVVTKDIPAEVVAAGNPCRVLRPIGAEDKIGGSYQM